MPLLFIMLWDWYQGETRTITDIKTPKCVPSVESVGHLGIFVKLVTNINPLSWDRWYCSLGWRTYPENVSVPRLKTQSMMMPSNGNKILRYWPSVRGIHKGNPRVTVGVPSQRPVTRSFVFFCAWTNCWTNNEDASDTPSHLLWRHFLYRSLFNTLRGK